MKPELRTKTPEECRAMAMLLGMNYSVTVHAFYKKGDTSSWVCAETMKPLTSGTKRDSRRDEYHGRTEYWTYMKRRYHKR